MFKLFYFIHLYLSRFLLSLNSLYTHENELLVEKYFVNMLDIQITMATTIYPVALHKFLYIIFVPLSLTVKQVHWHKTQWDEVKEERNRER